VSKKVIVDKSMIVEGLKKININKGDMLLVHSSLSSFGYVTKGANTVVDALLEVVGQKGTVMMPTFTHNRKIVFDPRKTPGKSGAVTETFWRRPEALRSLHTTHAYAAVGPEAEWLTEGHEKATTFGPNSPLGKLWKKDGTILLLGVSLDRATIMHFGERLAGAGCFGERTKKVRCINPETDKVISIWVDAWRSRKCPSRNAEAVTNNLRTWGALKEITIGRAKLKKVSACNAVEAFRKHMNQGWGDHPGCKKCSIKPRETELY